jgi:hypothetical protein
VLLPFMIRQVTGFMERISQMIINGA